jgi:hypothetical protein
MLNLTVRLAFNIAIEMLDEMIFILTNQSMLSSFQSTFNGWLDSLLDGLRPMTVKEGQEQQFTLVTASPDKTEKSAETQESPQTFGFFDNVNAPLHNAEDIWLEQLLAALSAQNDEVHEDQGHDANPLHKAAL